MRRLPPIKLPLIFLLAAQLLISLLGNAIACPAINATQPYHNDLKKAAFKVLDVKCNVCHRKRNPFMVFSERNMERRAGKIYTKVFIEGSMPKPEGQALTADEKSTLKKWLLTQNFQ